MAVTTDQDITGIILQSGGTFDSPTFTGVALFADGAVGAPSIAFSSAPTTGLYYASNAIRYAIGGSAQFNMVASQFNVLSDVGFVRIGASADVQFGKAATGIAQLQGTSSAVAGILRRIGGNAGYMEWGSVSENLTLSTSGTTTDTTADLLPANSYIDCVTARITTTIATATNWKLGDATTSGRFTAANSTLTAGTTDVGLVHCDVTGAGGPRQTAAAKVRVTTTGTPSAGAVRITSYYNTFVPATS